MSDNWRQQPQYKADVEQADVQVGVVEVLHAVDNIFKGTPMGSPLSLGRTDFENHDLNAMIDLVEHAKPEHLEQASKTLWDARTAIHDAATDLQTNLGQVDWEGEGADAFHKWTKDLINWTKDLATYADVAATQIDAAATGLASVRKSMPPRDTRPSADQKRPDALPKAKQVDTNPDYTAALKVEKNRQEAINQMNRLASFYSVSATTLKAAPEPQPLRGMPDVGVPQPPAMRDGYRRQYSDTPTPTAAAHPHIAESHAGTMTPQHGETGGIEAVHRDVHEPNVRPVHDVGTEINTVGTLPPPVAPAAPSVQPTGPGMPNAGGMQVPPLMPGPVAPPITPTTGRSGNYGPLNRLPVSGAGRSGGPASTASGRVPQGATPQTGRATGVGRTSEGPLGQAGRATGRAVSPGQQPVRGATQQPGRAPVGRGVTGGTPRVTNAPGGRSPVTGPTGAARNGVVGGKPVTGRTPGTTSGPRVPRGMVVGAEESRSSAPSKGAIGQRGVVGASPAKAEPGTRQSVSRSAGNSEGVIGASRNNNPSAGSGSEAGRKGLGRGAVGNTEAGRSGGPAEKERSRTSRQRRRDASKKSD
ncbi:hypothetical protein [Streptomyces sp. NPDC004100]